MPLMNLGVLNGAMLLGLLSVAVPVAIHFLNRRRDVVIDWGAMQFLELGRKARQKIKLTELLLMLSRMAVLAAVAFALSRPFWGGGGLISKVVGGTNRSARDVVIILDNSASMGRRLDRPEGETTPKAAATAWVKAFSDKLQPSDTLALIVAGDRVRTWLEPSFDRSKAAETIDQIGKRPPKGSSDLPAALVEALRVLERTENPEREIVLISDNQRLPWKPTEASRWSLIREIQKRSKISPRIWSFAFDPLSSSDPTRDVADGSVGPVTLSPGLATPGMVVKATAEITNHGPGPLDRPAELWVDGAVVPGSSQKGEPLPEGGKTALTFKTTLNDPGSHVVSIKLGGPADAMPGDDESSAVVEVTSALGVLLVEGEPGLEPFSSETDFLRAALAPNGGGESRAVAQVIKPEELTAASLQGKRVLVLANVERIGFDAGPAVAKFLDNGGGVLVAPGDRVDPASYNAVAWLPAKLGDRTGDFLAKKPAAHPNPTSFTGPVLSAFGLSGGLEEAPSLGRAALFGYFRLEPAPEGTISARLDTGEPWAVERSVGKGRALLLAGPLDAEGGTLPVNPDFVPLIHEWTLHLAGGSAPQAVKPGEPLVFELPPAIADGLATLPITTPDGTEAKAVLTRNAGVARARYEETSESGIYKLALPGQASPLYGVVQGEDRESDLARLESSEAETLAEGWPLVFESDANDLGSRILSGEGAGGGRQEFWKLLILAALGGLCVEIYLTRKLVRGQGIDAA